MNKAQKLIEQVRTNLSTGKREHSHRGTTWVVDGNKLSEHDDSTGNWHSVQKGSLTDHVHYVARACADWSEDAEGDVISALSAAGRVRRASDW